MQRIKHVIKEYGISDWKECDLCHSMVHPRKIKQCKHCKDLNAIICKECHDDTNFFKNTCTKIFY